MVQFKVDETINYYHPRSGYVSAGVVVSESEDCVKVRDCNDQKLYSMLKGYGQIIENVEFEVGDLIQLTGTGLTFAK